jgi:hypothetical protein
MLSWSSWSFDIIQELVVCRYEHGKKVDARLVIFDFLVGLLGTGLVDFREKSLGLTFVVCA